MVIEYVPAVITFLLGFYGMWLYAQHNKINLKNIRQLQIPIVVRNKQVLVALLTMVVSILTFVLASSVKLYFNPEGALISHGMWVYGTTPTNVIVGILTNPSKVIHVFFTAWRDKFLYLVYLFGPVAFLSFLDPTTLLLTAPWLLISFLSTSTVFRHIHFQYSAFVTPFVFISAVYGVRRISSMNTNGVRYIMKMTLTLLMFTSLIFSLSLSPLGIGSSTPKIKTHHELLNEIISFVPKEASILTQNDIFPHVSKRIDVYIYPPPFPLSFEYILVDTTSLWYTAHQSVPSISEAPSLKELHLEILSGGDYGIYASADGILLLKRGYQEEPVLFIPIVKTFTHTNLTPASDPVITKQYDPTSRSGEVLVHQASAVQSPIFWYGPYASFSPGWYEATFKLKSNNTKFGYMVTLDAAADSGRIVLSSRRVYGHDFSQPDKWHNITLQFLVPSPQLLEFRGVKVANSTNLYLDFIEVKQISLVLKERSLPHYFDFRELTLRHGSVWENLMIHSPSEPLGVFWYGPYITLPTGTYTVTFWIKTPKMVPSDPLLTLDVSADLGTRILASMNVTGEDFNEDGWQPFTLNFQLDETTSSIEFRGIVLTSKSEIILSNVELHTVIR